MSSNSLNGHGCRLIDEFERLAEELERKLATGSSLPKNKIQRLESKRLQVLRRRIRTLEEKGHALHYAKPGTNSIVGN